MGHGGAGFGRARMLAEEAHRSDAGSSHES